MSSDDVTVLTGNSKGPKSIIIAGVHGDEKCGIDAMEQLIPGLSIDSGSSEFIVGNPKAVLRNSRYIDTNLNRLFKHDSALSQKELNSYEYSRAKLLKKHLLKADILLDIHASRSFVSKPFVICDSNAIGIVKYLPVDVVVFGFDKIEPGGTDYFMNNNGKTGICYECGYLGNIKSIQNAKIVIEAFLKAVGHIENNLQIRKQKLIKVYKLYKSKSHSFILSKQFDDFDNISKGQIIGQDGNDMVYAKQDSLILFARNCGNKNEEAFLLCKSTNI